MAKHPAKTAAQRRVLDAIGCGEYSPIASKRTIQAMLDSGLIIELNARSEPFIGGLRMRVPQYDMPTLVHMEWCAAMAAECGDDD